MALMPRWLPLHSLCVYVSGAAEIALGLGVAVPICQVQLYSAWGLLALLAAVFPVCPALPCPLLLPD
jgi:uncharacterized membrane protein